MLVPGRRANSRALMKGIATTYVLCGRPNARNSAAPPAMTERGNTRPIVLCRIWAPLYKFWGNKAVLLTITCHLIERLGAIAQPRRVESAVRLEGIEPVDCNNIRKKCAR